MTFLNTDIQNENDCRGEKCFTRTGFHFEEGEVFLIDKPLDWTSFDVVNLIRAVIKKYHQIRKLKVGHAGTLDPLATGLLILCTGRMTKQIDNFQAQEKVYTGTMLLGQTTPTYDLESEPNQFFCHANGEGVESDPKRAVDLFRKASEQGNAIFSCSVAQYLPISKYR